MDTKFLSDIWSHWWGKVLFSIIILFIIVVVFLGFFKNRDIDLWGLKITQPKSTKVGDTSKSAIKQDDIISRKAVVKFDSGKK